MSVSNGYGDVDEIIVPDKIGYEIGYRAWGGLTAEGRLRPIAYNSLWTPNEDMIAKCERGFSYSKKPPKVPRLAAKKPFYFVLNSELVMISELLDKCDPSGARYLHVKYSPLFKGSDSIYTMPTTLAVSGNFSEYEVSSVATRFEFDFRTVDIYDLKKADEIVNAYFDYQEKYEEKVSEYNKLWAEHIEAKEIYETEKKAAELAFKTDHHPPVKDCSCGLWGCFTLEDVLDYFTRTYKIYGKIAMWGTVRTGTNGFRVQKAYPLEFYLLNGMPKKEEIAKSLVDHWNLPVHFIDHSCTQRDTEKLIS